MLCDFISDKAKRMLGKYEAATKDKKIMQEEKSYYFQRKVDALEAELKQSKQLVKFAGGVVDVIVPRLKDLLEHSIPAKDRIEYAYEVLQSAETEFRLAKKSNLILQERTNELQNQVEVYRMEYHRTDTSKFLNKSHDIEAKLRNARNKEHDEARNRSPIAGPSPPRMKESRSASRL